MDFYSVVESRKSIKKFKESDLDRDKIERMLTAAMMSPSWKNNSSYRFILVDSEDEKEQLAGTILNKDEDASEAVKRAPLLVIVTADPKKSGELDDREYYLVDSAIAMEHLVLAATAEGYGTCWIGSMDEDKVREILSIPEYIRVVAMTPVGEIENKEPHYEKKDIKDYVFHNSWNVSYAENQNRNRH